MSAAHADFYAPQSSLSPTKSYSSPKSGLLSPASKSRLYQQQLDDTEAYLSSTIEVELQGGLEYVMRKCPSCDIGGTLLEFFEGPPAPAEDGAVQTKSSEQRKKAYEEAREICKLVSMEIVKERPEDVKAFIIATLKKIIAM